MFGEEPQRELKKEKNACLGVCVRSSGKRGFFMLGGIVRRDWFLISFEDDSGEGSSILRKGGSFARIWFPFFLMLSNCSSSLFISIVLFRSFLSCAISSCICRFVHEYLLL